MKTQKYFSLIPSLLKYSLYACTLFIGSALFAQNVPNPSSTTPTGTATIVQPPSYVSGVKVNYVRTITPTVPVTTEAAIQATDKSQTRVGTQYMDGLGRPIQNVNNFVSPAGNDLVEIIQYDNMGRESNKFMPYVKSEATVNDNGKFKLTPTTDQTTFYQSTMGYSNENYFYSHTNYETSPLNRVEKSLAPGNAWVGSDKGQYSLETPLLSGESVRIWTIAYPAASLPVTSGIYNIGDLTKKEVVDEDARAVDEYFNKQGKLVMKCQYKLFGAGKLQTYYVYDDLGMLRFVIPPKATAWLASNSWVMTTAIANELCFSYQYDSRLRVISQNTPGAGVTSIVCNLKDQPSLTQNAEQKLLGQWTFIKYDALDRIIQTGVYNSTSTQAALQVIFNTRYRDDDPFLIYMFNDIYGNAAYLNTFSNAKVYATNYYDDYSFTTRTFNNSYMASLPSGWNNTLSNETINLLTGTKVLVLDGSATPTELLSVNYYNDRGSLLQTQAQNFKGGWNYITMSYDFIGNKLGILTEINNPAAINNATVTLLQTYTYDHASRILSETHKLNNNGAVPISRYNYDELGRIKIKFLGNNAEELMYDYNIRGWLTGINKDYCLNGGSRFFGEELSYDYGYNTNYLNGTIAGMKWRNKGKGTELRSYGYIYDDFGRLTNGDFVDNIAGAGYSNATKDYTASNMSYDENGNLLTMKQMGLNLAGTKIILDNLQYSYVTNSNKLQSVSELTGSQSTNPTLYDNLGDFRDVSGSTDYTYDGSGNLKTDANKSLAYNYNVFLNKPELITKGTNTVKYLYDGLGNKLQKVTTGANATTTDYIGNVIYTNNSLDYILHDEGRIRYTSSPTVAYTYDYFIKDHLGNTRSVVYEEVTTDPDPRLRTIVGTTYVATSELVLATSEDQLFDNVETTRSSKLLSIDPGDSHSAKLTTQSNARLIGPAITLKVMAGDSLSISAEALYIPETGSTTQQITQDIINNFATALTGISTILNEGGAINAASNSNGLANAILQMQQNNPDMEEPRAFLNYLLFDENMNLIPGSSGALKVKDQGNWKTLETETITVPENGFIQVFSSNTSTTAVSFDNLTIILYQGKLLEEYNYYPYGLVFDQTQAVVNTPKTNYLYNGKELQHNEFGTGNGLELCDYGARMYDSQIGRWNGVDPLAMQFFRWSPFNYCFSNPVRLIDIDGMAPGDGDPNNPLMNTKCGNLPNSKPATWEQQKEVLKGVAVVASIALPIVRVVQLPLLIARASEAMIAYYGGETMVYTVPALYQISNTTFGDGTVEYSNLASQVTQSAKVDLFFTAVPMLAGGVPKTTQETVEVLDAGKTIFEDLTKINESKTPPTNSKPPATPKPPTAKTKATPAPVAPVVPSPPPTNVIPLWAPPNLIH